MKKVVALLSMLAVSASAFAESAFKFDPYASIRAYYGYHNDGGFDDSFKTSVKDNELDQVYRVQGNTRFGANFSADNVKSKVELGLDSTVSLRIATMAVDFGGATLKVGQDYTPYTWLAEGDYADDNNLQGFGASYDGRTPQITISSNGVYAAFIKPTRTYSTDSTVGFGTIADTSVIYPKIALGYDYDADGIKFGFGGAFQQFKLNDSSVATPSVYDGKKITSYLAYVHTDLTFGMIVLRANVAYGQNAANFGIKLTPGNTETIDTTSVVASKFQGQALTESGSIKNSTHIEGYINPQVKLSPELTIGIGYGYQSDKSKVSEAKADVQTAYFVDAKYKVNNYFTVCPDFVYRDYMKNESDVKQGHEYYAGMKFQADFK